MARITVEDCLEKIPSRFDLILMASKRARQLSTTSRDPLVEWDNDKPTGTGVSDLTLRDFISNVIKFSLIVSNFS